MKFLAILKDSLREAIDTKVFYVMVGLSALLTLFTFTLSFKPGSGDMPMKLMAVSMTVDDLSDLRDPESVMRMAMRPGFKAYETLGAVPANGAPEGPESTYDVTLVAHCKTEAEADKLRADPSEVAQRMKERFGRLDELRLADVVDVRPAAADNSFLPKSPAPTDAFFEATVKPTRDARRFWPHEPSLFFGAVPIPFLGRAPLAAQLFILEDKIVGGIGAWVAILLSIIITAFFIPNMLRKGTVDLLLVKPVRRTTLLLYKYVGGLIFIFLNTAVVVFGVWVALGLRSGIWAPSFLLSVFVITGFFAILYGVSTLFAVLTRSPIVAILLTILVWFILWVIGFTYDMGEGLRQEEKRRETIAKLDKNAEPEKDHAGADGKEDDGKNPGGRDRHADEPELPFRSDNWFFSTVRTIHFVTPRTHDLDHLMSRVLIRDLLTANQVKEQKLDDTQISWVESLTVSGIFLALMLGLSCLCFATRDY